MATLSVSGNYDGTGYQVVKQLSTFGLRGTPIIASRNVLAAEAILCIGQS